jgi:hypothetical protein
VTAPRVRWRVLIERAVDDGLRIGFERAHKHADAPSRDHVLTVQEAAIWEQLDAVLALEDEP